MRLSAAFQPSRALHVARDAVRAQPLGEDALSLGVEHQVFAVEPAHALLRGSVEVAVGEPRRVGALAGGGVRARGPVELQPELRFEEPLTRTSLLVEPEEGEGTRVNRGLVKSVVLM